MACCLLVVTGMVKGDGRVLLGAIATNLAWEILLGDQYHVGSEAAGGLLLRRGSVLSFESNRTSLDSCRASPNIVASRAFNQVRFSDNDNYKLNSKPKM